MKKIIELQYDTEAMEIMQQILVCIDEFEELKKEVCQYCNELTARGYEEEGLKQFLNLSVDMKTLNY